MTEYELLSELLPVFSHFEIKNIVKREGKEVDIYLEIPKAHPKPENCTIISIILGIISERYVFC